jgi:hypothetical protein
MRRTRAVPLVVAAIAVAVSAIALFNRSSTSTPPPDARDAGAYERAHAGLCEALALVDADDPAAAQGVFLSRSHTTLHTLAADTADADRSVAARLLEAKAAVEGSLPTGASTATEDLRRLRDATASAIETVTGHQPPACP